VSIPAKQDHSDDADGGDEQSQPSSPSVKKTEEKGITVVHEVKCKLYVKVFILRVLLGVIVLVK
jgi:nuclear pore complex protein Nup50